MKYLLLSAFAFLSVFGLSYESCISYDCIFDQFGYDTGYVLDFACFRLFCNSTGNWEFNEVIPSYCDVCHVTDDPHFKTFDSFGTSVIWGSSNYYDWHGACNYSISQPFCDSTTDSYNPTYGIFGDFIMCSPTVSCVDKTTYKADENTVIQITHKPNLVIEINGNLITVPPTPGVPYDCSSGNLYPVVLWQDTNTVRIVGRDYSIQASTYFMFIWTTNSHQKQIGGLCGFYTGNTADDYQMRDCTPPTGGIPQFANSWLTQVQNADCVPDPIVIKEICENEEELRQNCYDAVLEQIRVCGKPLDPNDIQNAIDNCVEDCCANPETCDTWKKTAADYICKVGINSRMQERKDGQTDVKG